MMHLPFPRGASGDFTQSAPDLLIRSKSWKPLCQHSWSVGAPARHPVPEHFRQFCQKCSGSSKSEIEVPCPVSLPRHRNFQNTKHSPICGQYLCKHRAKISFAHLQGLAPDPYAACGRKGTLEKEKAAITGCQNKYQILGYLEINAWGI